MNKNLKVDNLTVQSFRGIRKELTLDFKDITILYGVNGMGKSSFVNSLEYLFSKKLSFLNKTTIDKKAPFNKKDGKKNMAIELKFTNGDYFNLSSSSSQFKEILKNPYVKKASFILNRSRLLEFIQGTQVNRYDAIMKLCGIEDINKIESAFSSSTSTLQKELKAAESNYDNCLSDLSNLLFGDSLSSYEECLNKLNTILNDNDKEIIDDDTDIDEFVNNLDISRYTNIKNKINEFNEIVINLDLSELNSNLEIIIDDYQNLASDNLKSSQYLLKTLNDSLYYLEFTDSDECPVCKTPIDSKKTLAEIKQRISEISESSSNFNNWKTNVLSLISKVENQIRICERLNETYGDFGNLTGDSINKINFDILINLRDDLEEFLDFKKVATDFTLIEFDELSDELITIKDELKDYETNHNIDELSNLYNALFKIKELNEYNKDIKNLIKQHSVAKRSFEIFKDTKETYINDMMAEIREDIKYFYEYIHGDDSISSPDIVLTDSKKIDVYLDSFGSLVDSRSYASEGHLDTLGICIFLAFNKKFNDLPLIVLDDVFTTVDIYHKDKIANLIIKDLSDYQFFITAHNVPWVNQIKDMCQASNKEYVLYEITDWSLEEGPVIETKGKGEDISERERKNTINNLSNKLKGEVSSIDDVFSNLK